MNKKFVLWFYENTATAIDCICRRNFTTKKDLKQFIHTRAGQIRIFSIQGV